MTWFRVDDSFYDHPKAIAAEPALGLWLRAGCWSAKQLTDGFIPASMLHTFKATTRKAQILVDARARPGGAGLWVPTLDGWQFHDWDDYQPSRIEVQDKRSKRAEAGRLGGRASGAVRRSNAEAKSEANASPSVEPPTRPDPTQEQKPPPATPGPPRPTAVGSRIPDPFEPTEAMLDWARREAPNAGRRDHDAFVDFWRGKSGAAARKVDWPATWRNWMRKASDERPPGRRSTTDERVAQARSLRDMAEQLDAADQRQIATVTQLTIGDAS